MSGIVGHQGSKSGTLGLFSGEWKLLNTTNLDSWGSSKLSFSIAAGNGMKPATFVRYRLVMSALEVASGHNNQNELWFRWNCSAGAAHGFSGGNYYGGRWCHGSTTTANTMTSALEENRTQSRICYFNGAEQPHGLSNCITEIDNLGVSNPGGGAGQHGHISFSTGYVHSTSAAMYAGVTAMTINNHADTKPTASGGELTALTVGVGGSSSIHFDDGYVRLYGLVK